MENTSWNYEEIKNFISSGIYSKQDLEALEDHLAFPMKKQALLESVVRWLADRSHPVENGNFQNFFDEETFCKVANSNFRRFYLGFLEFGAICAGLMGVMADSSPAKDSESQSQSCGNASSSTSGLPQSQRSNSLLGPNSKTKQPKLNTVLDRQIMFQSGTKAAECNQKLMRFIVDCNLPVSTVDKPSFRDYSKCLNSNYTPPGRKKMTELLEKKYLYLSEKLKKTLAELPALSLTTDIWTDSLNTKNYLGLTVHYIQGNDLKTAIIGVQELDKSHTSENIQFWIESLLKNGTQRIHKLWQQSQMVLLISNQL
ncbi:hypothetical protein TKK_0017072 [Trichogramma kaykai]